MKKVVVFNATFDGNTHEIIDSSIIIMLSMLYEHVTVMFLKERGHIISDIIKKQIDNQNIEYKLINNIKKNGAIHDLLAALREAWIILTGPGDALYFGTYNNMFSCHINNFIAKITKKQVILCCHSELNELTSRHSNFKNYWSILIRRFYLKTKFAKSLKLIVFGNHIINELAKYVDKRRLEFFYSIDHPYFSLPKMNTHTLNNHIKIAIIGSLDVTEVRGINNIIRLSQMLSNDDSISIHTISKISFEAKKILQECNVNIENETEFFFSRTKYESLIQEMDYIFVPYSSSLYNLIASGAVLQAIACRKPVIMSSNNYFRYLVSKYGQIGYFVEDYSCYNFIKLLKDEDKYQTIINQENVILKKLSPKCLVSDLKHIINA